MNETHELFLKFQKAKRKMAETIYWSKQLGNLEKHHS